MASSPNLFDKIKDDSLFILQSKIRYNKQDVVPNATWFNDTLHDEINDSIEERDNVSNISTLNDDLLEETKKDGESILQIWNNSVIRDLNEVVTHIITTEPAHKDYVCYLRDVYKGSIIPGLNNLLDMAGASTEIFVKEAKVRKIINKTSLPLEEGYSHYFKFDIQINTYINGLVLGLTSATDWATGYKEKNIDNLNFLWQYLLCFCYLCIVNDEYESHTADTLFKSFYYLRNICFSSFETIMGYNSIEYVRYPRWKIGYQEEENSILIFNYFKEQFWDIKFAAISTSVTHISRESETEYPYSLSQRMAAMNMTDRTKYVIPRKTKGDTSKEKKQCLSGFLELFNETYDGTSIEKEVKNLIWRVTKFSGDSSHIIYGILIESAIKTPIPIVFLLSERPMLARTTIQKYPENRQIYIRDVKKLTEVKPFLHHQTAHYITKSNKYNCIIRLLDMVLFVNKNSRTSIIPASCYRLYNEVVNYSDTELNINTEEYRFKKPRHTVEFDLYDKYTRILEIINIINGDTSDDYQEILNETITDITPIYNVVNILDFFSNELELNGTQEFIKKIKRILPKLTKLCTDRLPRRSGSYIAIYFTDYYKSLKADIMNNDLTEGLMILGNLVDFTINIKELSIDFEYLLTICEKFRPIFYLLIKEITNEGKLFESLNQISLNIKSSYKKIKLNSSISEIDWIETNLSKSQDDPVIISKLSNNIQTLINFNSFFIKMEELRELYKAEAATAFIGGKRTQNIKRTKKRKKMTLKNGFKIKKNSKYNDRLNTFIRNSKAKRKNKFKKFTKNSKLSKMKTLIGGMNSTTQENYDYRYIVTDSLNTYLEYLIHNQPLTKPMTNIDNVPLEEQINKESIKEISGITQDFTHFSDLYQDEGPIVVNIEDDGIEAPISNSNNDWLLNILYLYYDIFIDIIECALDLKQMGVNEYIHIIEELVDLRFEDRYVTTVGKFFYPEDLPGVIDNMKAWCIKLVTDKKISDIEKITELDIFHSFISSLDIYQWDENTINSNSTIKSVINNTIKDMNKTVGTSIPFFDKMNKPQKDLLIPQIGELYKFGDISNFNNIRHRFIQEMAQDLSAAAAGGYRDER